MNPIQQIEAEEIAKATSGAGKDIPEFRPGDTLRVGVKVVEGERSRVQNFEGVCIARTSRGMGSNFTVRKISFGEGVETFRRIVAMRGIARVVVSTADLEARLAQWVTAPSAEGDAGGESEEDQQATYERPDLVGDYVAPRDEVEEQIAAIWRQLLGIQQVGVDDDFLDLGGHSLLATQLIARIRSRMQVNVSLEDVFRGPTVAELARLVGERMAAPASGEAVDAIRARVSQMSPEERQRLLEQARRSKREQS